ncbi:MAG: hypothetical protein ABEK59_11160 [Halobacteria archaeon]
MDRTFVLTAVAVIVATVALAPAAAAQASGTTISASINGDTVNDGDTITIEGDTQEISIDVQSNVNITSVTSEFGLDRKTQTPQQVGNRKKVDFTYNESLDKEVANFTVTVMLEDNSEKVLSATVEKKVESGGNGEGIQAKIDKLEQQLNRLKQENQELKQKQSQLEKKNEKLRQENKELQSQIANQTNPDNNGTDGGNGQPGFTPVVALVAMALAFAGYRYR